MDATTEVREGYGFDIATLERYLAREIPGFAGPLSVRQFAGGQSNPTFCLAEGGRHLVLRKKPSGPILPSDHAVDREYRVLSALAGTDVPVPTDRVAPGDRVTMIHYSSWLDGQWDTSMRHVDYGRSRDGFLRQWDVASGRLRREVTMAEVLDGSVSGWQDEIDAQLGLKA